MNFAENYRFYGHADIQELQKLLSKKADVFWSDEVAIITNSHRESRNILLKNDIKPEHFYGRYHPGHEDLYEASRGILEKLQLLLDESYLIRLQFVRHLPNMGFKPHTDEFSYTLVNSHRIHIPIFSDNKFLFNVGGEEKYMAEGEIWEINNTRKHSGHNQGDKPRISMIACFARPLYTVRERVSFFMNLEKTAKKDGLLRCRPQLEGEFAPRGLFLEESPIEQDIGHVKKGVIVSINYILKDAMTGEVLSENSSNEPLSFLYGVGQLPPLFEAKIRGLKVQDTFNVKLRPEEGYGAFSSKLKLPVPDHFYSQKVIFGGLDPKIFSLLKNADASLEKEISSLIQVIPGKYPLIYRIKKEENKIFLDTNHPFSGRTLELSGKIASIRSLALDENKFAVYYGSTLASVELQQQALEALGVTKSQY